MPLIVDITVRTLLVFAALLLVTRLEAKKQIGQLTYFHYVTGIVLGSIAAQAVVDRTIGLVTSLFALVLWVVLMATMSWVSLKSYRGRLLLEGEPTLVVHQSKILEENLKKLRLTHDDLMMMLRQKGIFQLADVQTAIVEPNGSLSVIRTKEPAPLAYPLVVDGTIIDKNLAENQLDRTWLERELARRNVTLADVDYMALLPDGTVSVDLKEDGLSQKHKVNH